MENNTENRNNRKWYIVQVVTGYETKVKEDLQNRDFDKADIEEILLPQVVSTTKTGKVKRKSMFPGYLYVKVEMTDDSWFIIRNTNYVTGIVGSSGQRTKPTPVREVDILKIKERVIEEELRFQNIESGTKGKKPITELNYKIGDSVEIMSGEFKEQKAKLLSISYETQKVEVEIEFFGRMTNVKVDIDQIKKID